MIESRTHRLLMDGMGHIQGGRYKAGDGGERAVRGFVVADGQGGTHRSVLSAGVSGTIRGYAYAAAQVSALADYDLTGEAYPVGSTVHLSRLAAGTAITPEALTAAGTDTTEADGETGAFAFSAVEGWDGTAVVWIEVSATVLDLTESQVRCSMTAAVHPEEAVEGIQYVRLAAPTCSEGGTEDASAGQGAHWPTITGSRPTGESCAVYVSRQVPGTAITLEGLNGGLQTSLEAAGGDYTLSFSGEYVMDADAAAPGHEYVVWCQSEAEGLTAAMTGLTNNICLSGDTLITLADGSRRRLEDIRSGDLLLAGDGTPTRALRTARGNWNDRHTLYRFEDGTVIDEVHDHRFYNVEQGFWQLLRRWEPGQHALREDGARVALVSVEPVEERAEMFGLWTESRDYWANGLLSGETAANRALLAEATAEQAADMAASLEEQAVARLMGLEELL